MSNEKMIKILLFVRHRTTKNGRKFDSYRTKMRLETYEDGKSQGVKDVYVDVKFVNDLKDKLKDFRSRGYLTINLEDIDAPFRYEVKNVKDEETGVEKKTYPVVWIRNFVSYEPAVRKQTQSAFVLEEEEETAETEID